ncbi:MAG: DEAD/DEAH box helicase family protein, partial [Chloroflexota bacterium]|nr:DEAD/DEAH box helicase family protein [Chloroflexota bacterium]
MPLSEADTRAKLIDPAIHARGWTEDHIRREETAGAIEILDARPRRRKSGRTDYTLRIKVNPETQPVAVALIEAKAEDKPPTMGLEQGKGYCRRLNVPFVFSSNGLLFVEYDEFTGQTTRPRPLVEFPTPADLRTRYEDGMGFRLSDPAAKPLLARYPGGEATRRYYQDAAIRAVLEKIAQCDVRGEPKRALLSLATGSGKTFIAVNLLKRVADAGQLRKALFVCDRDELRSQGAGAFQNVFGADAATVSCANAQKNARVLIATYQTLDIDTEEADANFLTDNYPEDYFSHIIIDECHRSAWGKWSQVLTRNPNAVQVGLTATPRQLVGAVESPEAKADAQITADNYKWFGEPVYEYDIAQGIEDGYLAACEIVRRDIFIDDDPETGGISQADMSDKAIRDARTGQPVAVSDVRAIYDPTSFEDKLLLPERVEAMCKDLFQHLVETGGPEHGPEQKTIIFCARDRHADDVAAVMNNLYAQWCAANGHQRMVNFAFKCTAAAGGGDFLPDLRGASRSYFIATTVELLTTGVDVPVVRNIVFFKYVRSPIAFYQMIGRGTRIDEATNKLMFRVYDYTDATRLFGEDFFTKASAPRRAAGGGGEPPEPERIIEVEGFEVCVNDAGRYILDPATGQPMGVEEYTRRVTAKLVEDAPTIGAFRARWIERERRRQMLADLPGGVRAAALLRELKRLAELAARGDAKDYDLYDVLAELGYGLAPRSK